MSELSLRRRSTKNTTTISQDQVSNESSESVSVDLSPALPTASEKRRASYLQKSKDGSLIYTRRNSSYADNNTDGKRTSSSTVDMQSKFVGKRRRNIVTNAHGIYVEKDMFCWVCHLDGEGKSCEMCTRFYHINCITKNIVCPVGWICPECERVLAAEEKRDSLMRVFPLEHISLMFKYALQKMKFPESEPFFRPVDSAIVPSYTDIIFNPMDFATLEKKIKSKKYGSTEAFLADAKWILHNCIVFNGEENALSNSSKLVIKICKQQMSDIDICYECYYNAVAHSTEDPFCMPCAKPHPLVWAKMRGYPFWPAKCLKEEAGICDVRFFGEHDRSKVPTSQVFLLSEEPPSSMKKSKTMESAMTELNKYIQLYRDKFGNFEFAPPRTSFNPLELNQSISDEDDDDVNNYDDLQDVNDVTLSDQLITDSSAIEASRLLKEMVQSERMEVDEKLDETGSAKSSLGTKDKLTTCNDLSQETDGIESPKLVARAADPSSENESKEITEDIVTTKLSLGSYVESKFGTEVEAKSANLIAGFAHFDETDATKSTGHQRDPDSDSIVAMDTGHEVRDTVTGVTRLEADSGKDSNSLSESSLDSVVASSGDVDPESEINVSERMIVDYEEREARETSNGGLGSIVGGVGTDVSAEAITDAGYDALDREEASKCVEVARKDVESVATSFDDINASDGDAKDGDGVIRVSSARCESDSPTAVSNVDVADNGDAEPASYAGSNRDVADENRVASVAGADKWEGDEAFKAKGPIDGDFVGLVDEEASGNGVAERGEVGRGEVGREAAEDRLVETDVREMTVQRFSEEGSASSNIKDFRIIDDGSEKDKSRDAEVGDDAGVAIAGADRAIENIATGSSEESRVESSAGEGCFTAIDAGIRSSELSSTNGDEFANQPVAEKMSIEGSTENLNESDVIIVLDEEENDSGHAAGNSSGKLSGLEDGIAGPDAAGREYKIVYSGAKKCDDSSKRDDEVSTPKDRPPASHKILSPSGDAADSIFGGDYDDIDADSRLDGPAVTATLESRGRSRPVDSDGVGGSNGLPDLVTLENRAAAAGRSDDSSDDSSTRRVRNARVDDGGGGRSRSNSKRGKAERTCEGVRSDDKNEGKTSGGVAKSEAAGNRSSNAPEVNGLVEANSGLGHDPHTNSDHENYSAIDHEINFNGFDFTEYSTKLVDFAKKMCMDMIALPVGNTFRRHLDLELKRIKFSHDQQIAALKYNYALQMAEMRLTFEIEKERMKQDYIKKSCSSCKKLMKFPE